MTIRFFDELDAELWVAKVAHPGAVVEEGPVHCPNCDQVVEFGWLHLYPATGDYACRPA